MDVGGSANKSGKNGSRSSRRPTRPLKFNPPPIGLPPLLHFTFARPSGETLRMEVGTTRSINLMTEKLLEMFSQCNAAFRYDKRLNPRRVLTKPSRSTYNNGYDNEKHDYILFVNDIVGNEEGRKYMILDLLGQGTFGQVVKCQNVKTKEMVAIKVIKNQAAFFNQSMMEVTVLEMLNQKYDKDDKHHIVRMKDTFVFRQHLCIVVELLSLNLYDLIKQNQYRGFSLTLCRLFLSQILDSMKVLKDARIIHCDLKPENILLRNLESPSIKVIDFGSACHEHQTLYTYIQSRFYRSPEVLLGLPYSSAIDMWSLGCIAAELFLGLPIFPGSSNYDQINRIVTTLGSPPNHMLEVGKDTPIYFERTGRGFQLKSRDRYSLDTNRVEPPPKQYFSSTKLDEIILNYPIRPRDMSQRDRELEMANRHCFLDFIRGLLNLNPIERWSPLQAAQHPFITGRTFTGPFIPPPVITTVPIPTPMGVPSMATAGTIRVKVGQRPRANTLSSLSLQDVPPQIQRITAANKDKNVPGIGPTERTDIIPETIMDISDPLQPTLPFETFIRSGNGSMTEEGGGYYTGMASGSGSLSKQQVLSGKTSVSGSSSAHTERMSAYVSNRRVSQPVNAFGRVVPRSSQGDLDSADIIPSSVPTVVWYGPDPSYVSGGGTESKRRNSSMKLDDHNSQWMTSNPNSYLRTQPNPATIGSNGGGRRASAPSIQIDALSTGRRKQSVDSPRRSNLSTSFVNAEPFPMTLDVAPLPPSSYLMVGNEEKKRGSSTSSMDILDEEDEDADRLDRS